LIGNMTAGVRPACPGALPDLLEDRRAERVALFQVAGMLEVERFAPQRLRALINAVLVLIGPATAASG